MESVDFTKLINFLQEELAISAGAIAMVLRQRQDLYDPLPMLLWQYGLISIEQLDKIFDWQDQELFNTNSCYF